MNDHDKENYVWREYWISSEATKSQRQFVRIDDTQTVSEWLRPPTDKNISVSTGIYAEPRQESTYCAPLYFEISGEQFARLCHCTKKVLFYMQKHWKIPGNCVEIICDANTTLTLIVPPVVFDCPPNPLMDEINFYLAHTLMEAGFAEVDVEIYKKEYYLPVPNSRRMVSDRPFVVALSAEELRLSPTKIQKLAEKQRWPACPAKPRRIAEAVKWFTHVYNHVTRHRRLQDIKYAVMLEKCGGWQTPPCIEHLQEYMPLGDRRREAGRIIANYLAWIKASPETIKQRLYQLGVYPIKPYIGRDWMIEYALEHPGFDGCANKMLQEYCRRQDGCFTHIWDELDEQEKKLRRQLPWDEFEEIGDFLE